mgnify:CR=1 FL=1
MIRSSPFVWFLGGEVAVSAVAGAGAGAGLG